MLPATWAHGFSSARERWPKIQLDPGLFEGYVRARSSETPIGAPRASAEAPDFEALFLCCACVHGDGNACSAFNAIYARPLREAIARIESDSAFVDDVAAHCLDKLLVGAAPRLAQYSGRGDLKAWLKRVASRAALDTRRRRRRFERPLGLAASIPESMSPESSLFCSQHAQDVVSALEKAIRLLAAEERSLLYLHYADGLSIDAIGDLQGVHRATAARRLQRVRETVELAVKTELAERCGADSSDVASLIKGTRGYQEACLQELLMSNGTELAADGAPSG